MRKILILILVITLTANLTSCIPKLGPSRKNLSLVIGSVHVFNQDTNAEDIGWWYNVGLNGRQYHDEYRIVGPDGLVWATYSPKTANESRKLLSGQYKVILGESQNFLSETLEVDSTKVLPVLGAKLDEVSQNRIKVSWNNIAGAKSYFITLRKESSFNILAVVRLSANDSSLILNTDNTYNAFPLEKGATYHLVISAFDEANYDYVYRQDIKTKQINMSEVYIKFKQ